MRIRASVRLLRRHTFWRSLTAVPAGGGPGGVQGNVDPVILFAQHDAITAAVQDVLRKAGPRGHILNLGHGVVVKAPPPPPPPSQLWPLAACHE